MSLSILPERSSLKKWYKPILTKVFRVPSPWDKSSSTKSEDELVNGCIEQTGHLMSKRGQVYAGLIMESGAQVAGGGVIYREGCQKQLSDLCKKYDILLIVDEIATGFGRLGNMI
jgi:adenosylmethionine---8-amino-7-oxononanoate aminotransferase